MVHDGNHYFEHCYGADFNPHVRESDREACWNAWLAHYTRHQPAHRIDYAMRRVEALQSGEPAMGLPGISQAENVAPVDSAAEGLVTLHGPRAGAEVSTILDSHANPQGVDQGCGQACDAAQSVCNSRCPADVPACLDGCKRDRALCLGGCY
jgi:hypothetical protein